MSDDGVNLVIQVKVTVKIVRELKCSDQKPIQSSSHFMILFLCRAQ